MSFLWIFETRKSVRSMLSRRVSLSQKPKQQRSISPPASRPRKHRQRLRVEEGLLTARGERRFRGFLLADECKASSALHESPLTCEPRPQNEEETGPRLGKPNQTTHTTPDSGVHISMRQHECDPSKPLTVIRKYRSVSRVTWSTSNRKWHLIKRERL